MPPATHTAASAVISGAAGPAGPAGAAAQATQPAPSSPATAARRSTLCRHSTRQAGCACGHSALIAGSP